MTPAELAEHAEQVAAAAPPLTAEQVDELTELLAPFADRRAAA